VCGIFNPASLFSDLFIRPTPYTTWEISLISGSIVELGGTPARVQVLFNVVSQTPDSQTDACDTLGALKVPPPAFLETKNVFGASLGATCHWKYTNANRQALVSNDTPTSAPTSAQQSSNIPDWLLLSVSGIAGFLSLVTVATLVLSRRRKKSDRKQSKHSNQINVVSLNNKNKLVSVNPQVSPGPKQVPHL
jgi:hypothetical protein